MDRLARSFARQIARMQSPCMIVVHGAPGSAKRSSSRASLAWSPTRALGSPRDASCTPRWLDAWSYAKQGNVLAVCGARGATRSRRSRDARALA